MNIKSKKWYENQIKALENAIHKLQTEGERLSAIYWNDNIGLFAARKTIILSLEHFTNRLNVLKDEYYLFYK